jgi:glyoxylase-like metal-dependent hydrolase (beta-lactamase superfamily II)
MAKASGGKRREEGAMAEVEMVAPGVRRVLAPNPSPLTFQGTNSYIVGVGNVAVIDPGPKIPAHLDALLAALGPDERVSAILVTHPHLDHSGLAPALARATGAPVHAAGTATEGRSALMETLAASGLAGGGEGLDLAFRPDVRIADGSEVAGPGWRITAIATPGHLGTHLAFAFGDIVFSGDHVMGWSTTIVSPPDGDMGAYMASLDRLAEYPARLFLPGHGPAITNPAARIKELVRHRRGREAAILAALGQTFRTARELTEDVYTDTSPALLPAAERNVLAHLIDLSERGLVAPNGLLGRSVGFRRTRLR